MLQSISYLKFIYHSLRDKRPKIPMLLNGEDFAHKLANLIQEVKDGRNLLDEVEDTKAKRARAELHGDDDMEDGDQGGEKTKEDGEEEEEIKEEGENGEASEEDGDEEHEEEEEVSKSRCHHLNPSCVVPKCSSYYGPNLPSPLLQVLVFTMRRTGCSKPAKSRD